MCFDTIKAKIKERFKEWYYCDIERLKKENEKMHYWAATFMFNSIIFVGIFYYFMETNYMPGATISLIMACFSVIMGIDKENDRNRINMWIYLKEKEVFKGE